MNPTPTTLPEGAILAIGTPSPNLKEAIALLTSKGYLVHLLTQLPIPPQTPPFNLLLIDLIHPDTNGYKICQHLKTESQTQTIPIILIASNELPLDTEQLFSLGGADYIPHPLQPSELFTKINTHLKLNLYHQSLQAKQHQLVEAITEKQIIELEKMATLGKLTADIIHEINNPLGVISSSIENLIVFFKKEIKELMFLLKNLDQSHTEILFKFLERESSNFAHTTTREKRYNKRKLTEYLVTENIDKAEELAEILLEFSLDEPEELAEYLPLLRLEEGEDILNKAYHLFSLKRSSQVIETATERATKVVQALKKYARHDRLNQKIKINLIEGLEMTLILYQNSLKKGVEVIRNYQDRPLITGYPDELNQVWTNLIHNALDAMNNEGTLTIDVRIVGEKVSIGFTDTGMGVPPEIQNQIFQPFFTTKPAGAGSGLGLDIVKKILDKHQGSIELVSHPGQTTFTVLLPITSNQESK